jgi:hypothetical protein
VVRLYLKHGLVNDVGIAVSRVLWNTQPLIIKDQEIAIPT